MKALKTRSLFLTLALAALLAGCEAPAPRPTDAELHLTPDQAAGRRVYDTHCLGCHEAYVNRGHRGPSLMGVFKKSELPSGTPANDDRVSDVILNGRAKMPAFRDRITPDQLKSLLDYMHTL